MLPLTSVDSQQQLKSAEYPPDLLDWSLLSITSDNWRHD